VKLTFFEIYPAIFDISVRGRIYMTNKPYKKITTVLFIFALFFVASRQATADISQEIRATVRLLTVACSANV